MRVVLPLLLLLATGCLPGERSNDPLPDVKVDTTAADAKSDAKTDAKGDTAGDTATDTAPADDAEDATETTEDVPVTGTLGCKGASDCAALPTLPCHATPTCNADTGLCDSPALDEGAACSTDLCMVGQKCDADGACTGSIAKDCSDGNACTLDLCGNGVCSHPMGNGNCTDGVQCTVSDHCDQGKCLGSPLNCDDGDPCTDDTCNETGDASVSALNLCKHQGFSYASKVKSCTPPDPADAPFCNNGSCGMAKDCDDKNPCTSDGPNALSGACDHIFVGLDIPCGTDKCNPGKCKLLESGPDVSLPTCVTAAKCDDDKPCTTDKCDANTGVCDNKTTLKLGTPCTSSDPCVGIGQCDGKTTCKASTPVVCNDGNPCTDDACIAGVGCAGTANSAKCSDGNGCTLGDVCSGGICGGTAVNCDDGNACTIDACNPLLGCSHTLAGDGTDCGNNSTCSQGICKAK